jgi:hypothetical protein
MNAARLGAGFHWAGTHGTTDGRANDARNVQRMLAHGDAIASKCGGISFIKGLIAREFGYGSLRANRACSPGN